MTDRGIQLETPRPYFLTPFTPNAAFYVRYHLDLIPNAVDLSTWRLSVEGNVERPLQVGFEELVKSFKAVSVAAVNQCSGNSRSRFQPRVPGAQWGNGGMGNARWTGVRLRELLASAGIKSGTVQLQFQGLDRGPGPEGKGAEGSTALSQATKVPGLVQEGSYDPGNLGMQMQRAPQNDDTGAVYVVGPWPTYTPPLADGEGRELVQAHRSPNPRPGPSSRI